MNDIIIMKLFIMEFPRIITGINPEVKELFKKNLIIRWQKIYDNKIIMEIKRND